MAMLPCAAHHEQHAMTVYEVFIMCWEGSFQLNDFLH